MHAIYSEEHSETSNVNLAYPSSDFHLPLRFVARVDLHPRFPRLPPSLLSTGALIFPAFLSTFFFDYIHSFFLLNYTSSLSCSQRLPNIHRLGRFCHSLSV